jgi:8-oxo-dGTP pyrophosphatase MutT (NUDIX family)
MADVKTSYIDFAWKNLIGGVRDIGNEHTNRVSVVLLFNQGKILGVSRKTDPNDFGLPGGKLDPEEKFEEAAIREVKEETGLDIFGLTPVFYRMDGDFFAVCYVAQWKGEIDNTRESGVVKWVDFEVIKQGSFGQYNTELEKSLMEKGFFSNKAL